MQSRIVGRIAAQTGMPRLFPALAEDLSASDLQSLLLAVMKSRARRVREPEALARAGRTLVAPSTVDARLLHLFDRSAFAAAEGFEALDLSPVCPLGTTTALGGIDQDHVLTALRNTEVLGDSTPALALECAVRRREIARRTTAPVRLCASHRVVRLQPIDFPGYTPHFRLFSMVSAGRDTGSSEFELRELAAHTAFYLRLFRALNAEGFQLETPLVEFSDLAMTEAMLTAAGVSRAEVREKVRAHVPGGSERFLAERGIALPGDVTEPEGQLALVKERVVDPLRAEYPEARFRFNLARLEGLGYYTRLCLRISPTAPDGVRYPAVDGGFTDWTARLLQDNKERLLTSGIGSEFICRRYRR